MCVCPVVPPVPARVTFCAHESKPVTPIDTVLRDTAPIQKYRVVGQVVAVWPQDVRLFSVRDPTTCVLRCSGASVFLHGSHSTCLLRCSGEYSYQFCLVLVDSTTRTTGGVVRSGLPVLVSGDHAVRACVWLLWLCACTFGMQHKIVSITRLCCGAVRSGKAIGCAARRFNHE